MNKTYLADKFAILMKLGFIGVFGAVLYEPILMLWSTALTGAPTLLFAGSVNKAHFSILLAMLLTSCIRDLLMDFPLKNGVDGYLQWVILMWIVPMLAAPSLYWLVGSVMGLEVEIPEGGHGPTLFAALAFVMVLVMDVFNTTWWSIRRAALWAWNRVPERA
ncbi:hypothetical protein ACRCPS_31085 [Pseudomonas aeruginosa]